MEATYRWIKYITNERTLYIFLTNHDVLPHSVHIGIPAFCYFWIHLDILPFCCENEESTVHEKLTVHSSVLLLLLLLLLLYTFISRALVISFKVLSLGTLQCVLVRIKNNQPTCSTYTYTINQSHLSFIDYHLKISGIF